jgi:hypothetical protein
MFFSSSSVASEGLANRLPAMMTRAKFCLACRVASFWRTAGKWPFTSPITALVARQQFDRLNLISDNRPYILEVIWAKAHAQWLACGGLVGTHVDAELSLYANR